MPVRRSLVWAVKHRTGIDLGDGRLRGLFTDYGKRMLEEQLGAPVRNSVHGTDVYEARDGLVFVSLNAEASVGRNADAFRTEVGSVITKPLGLSEKQLLAAELYSASYFDLSFRSRFITLITAVEAILQPEQRIQDLQAFLADCQAGLDILEVTPAVKQSVRSGLEWLKSESISHTGRVLCERLLGHREYKAMRAARFFTYCYGIRSEIVHNGKPSDPVVDFLDLANTSQRFVGDLLLASFGLPLPD